MEGNGGSDLGTGTTPEGSSSRGARSSAEFLSGVREPFRDGPGAKGADSWPLRASTWTNKEIARALGRSEGATMCWIHQGSDPQLEGEGWKDEARLKTGCCGGARPIEPPGALGDPGSTGRLHGDHRRRGPAGRRLATSTHGLRGPRRPAGCEWAVGGVVGVMRGRRLIVISGARQKAQPSRGAGAFMLCRRRGVREVTGATWRRRAAGDSA